MWLKPLFLYGNPLFRQLKQTAIDIDMLGGFDVTNHPIKE